MSEGTRAESHRALSLFSILRFFLFSLFFFPAKKMTALKWPRPGGFHIRDAILARRHSRFSHFFGKISDGKLSILRFFAKKCDGAKLAPSRGWRFRDVILTRRREQQIPPCARSFSIFDKKNVVAETHEISNLHTRTHARCRRGAKKRDRRKLITDENNGSRDAPTTAYPRDANSR